MDIVIGRTYITRIVVFEVESVVVDMVFEEEVVSSMWGRVGKEQVVMVKYHKSNRSSIDISTSENFHKRLRLQTNEIY